MGSDQLKNHIVALSLESVQGLKNENNVSMKNVWKYTHSNDKAVRRAEAHDSKILTLQSTPVSDLKLEWKCGQLC